MGYLVSSFWFALLVALVIGLFVGWNTFRGRSETFWRGLIPWVVLLGIGGIVAALQLFPDRLGFWFDLFVLLAFAYFIGCLIAYFLRFQRSAEPVAAGATTGLAAAGLAPTATRSAEPPPPAKPVTAPPASQPVHVEPAADPPVRPAEVAVEPAASPVTAAATAMPAPEEAITGLSAPRAGKPDDLTRIYGIDPDIERKLNALGIYHYDQLAAMRPGQRRWLFARLGHEGRFPSWWWRWRFDAEQILSGKGPSDALPGAALGLIAAAPDAPTEALAPAPSIADAQAGKRPEGLAEPRGGKADDLKRIRGIGKQNEGRLHALGIWHFDQIAGWSADEALWVGSYLAFPGRIERENWIGQAKVLAAGGVTDFAKRVDRGEVATSLDGSGDLGQSNIAELNKPAPPPKKP